MKIFGHHLHHSENPWCEAPPWALELRQIGLISLENQEKQMPDLTKLSSDIDALIAAVNALPKGPPPDNQAAVDALAAKVEATTASLTTPPAPPSA